MTSPNQKSSFQPSFTRDVLTLVKGTTISLIITIFASPIITRLYGPEAFGLVALFISITGIIGVVACLRYEAAIVLPKSDVEAANVLGLCILIVIFVSLATIPVIIVLKESLIQFLKTPNLEPFFWLIPPTLLIGGTFLVLTNWNTRTRQFNTLSIARVANSFATTGTQLGAGFLGYASGSVLIGTYILGQIVSTLIVGIHILRKHLPFFKQSITWQGIIEVLKRYSNFPKYDAGSEFINTLSWQIPIFLLAYFFSTTIVGYFSLGMMVITYPMILIGTAISQVFFQKAAMAKHEGSLSIIFEDIYTFLIKISLFPLLLLTFIGRDLFVMIFGPSWGEAGYYIQILSVWGVFLFISSPISSILSITGKQKIALMLSTINLITRFLSIYIGGVLGSPVLAIFLFSLSGIVVYGINGIYFMHLAGVKSQKTLNIILVHFFIFIPAGAIMLLSKILGVNSTIEIILAALLLLIYGGYLIKTDPIVQNILMDYNLLKKDSPFP
jgi:lipopolysaccharide exporter